MVVHRYSRSPGYGVSGGKGRCWRCGRKAARCRASGAAIGRGRTCVGMYVLQGADGELAPLAERMVLPTRQWPRSGCERGRRSDCSTAPAIWKTVRMAMAYCMAQSMHIGSDAGYMQHGTMLDGRGLGLPLWAGRAAGRSLLLAYRMYDCVGRCGC